MLYHICSRRQLFKKFPMYHSCSLQIAHAVQAGLASRSLARRSYTDAPRDHQLTLAVHQVTQVTGLTGARVHQQ